MRIIVLVMAIVTMLLLYMLTIATGHASILSDYFWWIFGFNAVALLVLLGIVGKQLWQIVARRAQACVWYAHRQALGFNVCVGNRVAGVVFVWGIGAVYPPQHQLLVWQ